MGFLFGINFDAPLGSCIFIINNLMKMKTYLWILFLVLNSFWLNAQEQISLFFDSNKYELKPSEKIKFEKWINENSTSKIVAINGFTDEDGTTGFNDTLAKKRVHHIFELVEEKIKIRDDYKTISFGENHKHNIDKAQNRKVVIYYLLEKDLPNENKILGLPEEIIEKPKTEIEYPEKIVFENPNGSKTEFKLDKAFMKKIGNAAVGEKLTIENLNFIVNTFAVVPESRGKLYELLLVLQNNPSLKIEIQGHLCCMPTDRLNLSTQRAKAVYNFLIANEIYPGRLAYKGFGSTQPLFPLPEKNETERAANRRVEILIVSN